jgi:hypothetical protein
MTRERGRLQADRRAIECLHPVHGGAVELLAHVPCDKQQLLTPVFNDLVVVLG